MWAVVATKAVFLEQLSPCACMLNFLVWLHELYENIVQLLSRVQLFVITWTAARQTSLSITVSWSLLKCMSMESVMPSNHLILCRSLLLSSIFPSIRFFFQWVDSSHHFSSVQFSRSVVSYSVRPHGLQHARPPCLSNILATILHIRWPNYWSFSFSISPFNEYLGLISFRMDSLDLLAIQGTLKSLLQHHSSKASILWRSAFFMIQLLHPYMTTGKTIALRYVNTL